MTISPDLPTSSTPPATPVSDRFSWSGVVAGVVIALAALIAMGELCAAIGLSAVKPADGTTPDGSTLVMGGAIGWLLSSIIALYLGGWTAGHVARRTHSVESTLQGVLVWGVSAILIATLGATALGGLVGGVLGLTGAAANAAGTAAQGVARAGGEAAKAPGYSWDAIRDDAATLFAGERPGATAGTSAGSESAGAPAASNAAAGDALPMAAVERVFGSPDASASDADRSALTRALTTRGHLSQAEADARVSQWQASADSARQQFAAAKQQYEAKAREVAQRTAKTASLASFFALAATLLGLSAAALGGHVGGHTAGSHRVVVEERPTGRPVHA